MAEPLVIVAAVNGGMQMSRDGAKVPITPEEIAEDACRCREAGAAIVHIHARDVNGRNTGDTEVFGDIITRVRDRTDILIQTTNGIGVRHDPATGQTIWPTDEERLALVNLDPSPDLYGVAAGSTDFLHPEGGYHVETPYVNSAEFLKETIKAVYTKPSTLEYEIVDTHALDRLSHYADEGIFDRDADYIWLLYGGGLGFVPGNAEYLVYAQGRGERLFPNALWGVLGGGRDQLHVHDARHLHGLHDRAARVRGRALPTERRGRGTEPPPRREARRDRRALRATAGHPGRGARDHGPEPREDAGSRLTCRSKRTSPFRRETARRSPRTCSGPTATRRCR